MSIAGLIIMLASVQATASTPAQPAFIVVHVAEAGSGDQISGAHVFLLAEDGRVLEEAQTDKSGEVKLKPVYRAAKPAFLFAEHEWYSISGWRWRVGAFEYCIDLVPVHSCDYTTVTVK